MKKQDPLQHMESPCLNGLAFSEDSGYNMARMRYEIIFSPEAAKDFKSLKAHLRSLVRDGIERHLRFKPEKESKSRIKKLKKMNRPQYRLRVGEIRVFYDVRGNQVEILAMVQKSEAASWLESIGRGK